MATAASDVIATGDHLWILWTLAAIWVVLGVLIVAGWAGLVFKPLQGMDLGEALIALGISLAVIAIVLS
jgi:hypothetical protein